MPYGSATARLEGDRLVIEIDLPRRGELSVSGRAENLVDPQQWLEPDDDSSIGIKLAVCRRLRRMRR